MPLLALGLTALLPFAIAISVGACGGDDKKVNHPESSASASTGSTGATASTPTASATDTASGSSSTTAVPPQASRFTSKKATVKQDPAFAACHANYKPTSNGRDLNGDVTKMAKMCEAATKMHLVAGGTFKGSGSEESRPAHFKFKAKSGKCYRAFAESDPGIKDLDMQIKDSADETAGEDATDDPSPIVMEDGAVCFTTDDEPYVSLAVGMGKGNFAIQVWSDE